MSIIGHRLRRPPHRHRGERLRRRSPRRTRCCGTRATSSTNWPASARELDAETIVVGIPRRAHATRRAEVPRFRRAAAAENVQTGRALGRSAAPPWKPPDSCAPAARKRRDAQREIDMHAAAVILQSYLDEPRREGVIARRAARRRRLPQVPAVARRRSPSSPSSSPSAAAGSSGAPCARRTRATPSRASASKCASGLRTADDPPAPAAGRHHARRVHPADLHEARARHSDSLKAGDLRVLEADVRRSTSSTSSCAATWC